MLRSLVSDHVEAAMKEGSFSTSRNVPILPFPCRFFVILANYVASHDSFPKS